MKMGSGRWIGDGGGIASSNGVGNQAFVDGDVFWWRSVVVMT
jgi:hypothetical protein